MRNKEIIKKKKVAENKNNIMHIICIQRVEHELGIDGDETKERSVRAQARAFNLNNAIVFFVMSLTKICCPFSAYVYRSLLM